MIYRPILLAAALLVLPATVFAQSGMIGRSCQDDIELYCPNISHVGGAVRLCLGEHLSQVSTDCRAALEAAGPGNMRHGWGGQTQRPNYMGIRQILMAVESRGYTDITEIEFEGGHYEVEATSPNGNRVELYVDAVTGKILRSQREDD